MAENEKIETQGNKLPLTNKPRDLEENLGLLLEAGSGVKPPTRPVKTGGVVERLIGPNRVASDTPFDIVGGKPVVNQGAAARARNVDNSGLTKEPVPAAQYKEEKAMDEKVGRQR